MNTAVGRIVDLQDRLRTPLVCSNCPVLEKRIQELERAVRKHKEAWEMSRAISADVQSNEELWGMVT